jgi:hypothetical protein
MALNIVRGIYYLVRNDFNLAFVISSTEHSCVHNYQSCVNVVDLCSILVGYERTHKHTAVNKFILRVGHV